MCRAPGSPSLSGMNDTDGVLRGLIVRMVAVGAVAWLLVALNPWGGIAAAGAASAPAQTPADLIAEVTGAPGVAVAEIDLRRPDPGDRVRITVAGQDGAGRPVTADTPFVWGSVSKPVTAAVIAGLGIPPSRPLGELLPELRDTDLVRQKVTVGELLAHTSGLPHDLDATDVERATGAAEVATGRDSPVRVPLPAPGLDGRHPYRYSSLNYLLLQAVAERAGDLDAAFQAAAPGVLTGREEMVQRVAPGEVPFLAGGRAVQPVYDRAGLGYGYLSGSATTLADFVSTQLVSPQVAEPESGWQRRVEDDGHGPRLYHSGAIPGFYTHVEMRPGAGRAVVVLANRYGELEAERLAGAAQHEAFVLLDDPTDPEVARPAALVGMSPVHAGVVLGGAAATLALLVAATTVARGSGRGRGGGLASVVIGGTVAVAGAAGPFLAGYPLPLLQRWAPDLPLVQALVVAGGAGLAVAGLWRLGHAGTGTGNGGAPA